jgi:DNA-binding NarL/FixJ family response regulator
MDRSRSRSFAAGSLGQRQQDHRRQLDASEETVKAHMRKILSKLHENDRTHAVAIAVKRGMIEI